MIPSIAKKTISLAISLLVVVISLTGVALGAGAPSVSTLTRYTPGFAGDPGKMARDAAGNFYVADFWGKRIIKLDRNGNKLDGFIATTGRPTAVAVMKDNRLVVAMTSPQPKIAFYKQFGDVTTVSGEESGVFEQLAPTLYRPIAITTDDSAAEYIYVLDSGDSSNSDTVNRVPKIRVYDNAGGQKYTIGTRTFSSQQSIVLDDKLHQPSGIAYEKAAQLIVVADTMNGRLVYYSRYNGTSMAPTSFIGSLAGRTPPSVGSAKFANPVDVAFQYDEAQALQRIYVAERGRDEVSVLDSTTNLITAFISSKTASGAGMKLPSSLLFETTYNNAAKANEGVLYVTNAATSTAANILALSIDEGAVPVVPQNMLTMNAVPATSASSPISVSGTTSSAAPVSCTVNGGADGALSGMATWTVSSLDLTPNKINHIVCQTTNSGGVTAYAEASTFYGTPTAAPTITITQPSGTIYTGISTVTVSGTTTPGNATVTLANSLGGTVTTTSDANGNWSKLLTLTTEGINQITAKAKRQGTDESAGVARDVIYDISDPVMTDATISFIAGGATTTNAVQNLDGIVTEANLQSITVNGMPVAASAQVPLGNNTYFSIPLTLNRGSNTVTVTATDKVGRVKTVSRNVTLAPEKPGFISIALPVDNKFRPVVAAESASGTVDPSFDSVVVCGGTSVDPDTAGNWSTTSGAIGNGFVSCQLTASGGVNTTVNEKRTFITDAAYGLVAITSPAADLATKVAGVTVSGFAAPGATPQISINGVTALVLPTGTYDSETGAFTYPVTLLQGLNTIKIISSGASAVRNIIYDTTAPELSIQADSKPMPTYIYGALEPSVKMAAITASLDNVAVTPAILVTEKVTFDPYDQSGKVTWKADLSSYAYDKISFKAIDSAGNETVLFYASGIPTGDIDGDGAVRLADALAALRHAAGTEVLDPEIHVNKFFNGDVGQLIKGRAARDGIIDITDSVLILNKAYGLMAF